MQYHRLIPVLLLKHGLIVRSQNFSIHQIIGNPVSTIDRLSNWNVDELVLLDISGEDRHDMRRDDHFVRFDGSSALDLLRYVSDACAMPLAFGGRIRTLEDIRARIAAGADKCIINTEAFRRPALISEAASTFGAQCVVVSIDALRHENGQLEVCIAGGAEPTGVDPADWAREAERSGAGEIFLNSIDRDGLGNGYDLDLIRHVTDAVSIPVIACGGVGAYPEFPTAITDAGASAVAAANIFHFHELSYPRAKRLCIEAGVPMRPWDVSGKWFARDVPYDTAAEQSKIDDRLTRAKEGRFRAAEVNSGEPPPMTWCRSCVYPVISATPMSLDEDGVCMGCRMAEIYNDIDDAEWKRREGILFDILDSNRSCDGSRYDCIVPVSGGKDSYFQVHYVKSVLGLNPLLVTYYGNNYTEVGQRNLLHMKEAFDVDHIIVQPGVGLLQTLNRLGLTAMGDMNWHNHVGIATVPMQTAVQKGISVVLWGEHGYADICGQYSNDDFFEWTYRNRREHMARGFEWNYFVGMDGITAQDMMNYRYPSDENLFELGLRGVYLANFIHWDANHHIKLVREKYGFEISDEPFERTYRRMSNLDDMHENGVHDYLKFIKFGYGRCTDHASKDVRAGEMSRDKVVELVRHHHPIKPKDLKRWLDYVGMEEDAFDRIADTFRDPRVWAFQDGEWIKANLWD
jgi:imidazoleglycerol phosphate synthase cyclase subunit